MAFEFPPRQRFVASKGNGYSFCYIPPQASRRTLLFLHGFPSQLYDWSPQIAYFTSRGYGIVAPDLLGYGQSSQPAEAGQYRLKLMSDDLIELLDELDLSRVVGVGHDFGATLLSRAVAYYPERWDAVVFLAVGPPRMGTPFDVDGINAMTKQLLGYELLGYISWLADEDGDAQGCLEQHAASAMTLVFAAEAQAWTDWFRPLGKMRQFVTQDRRVRVGEWYTPDLQARHLEAFARPDGYKGATRWYRMWAGNIFAPDEAGLEKVEIRQPALFVGGSDTAQQRQMVEAWVPNLSTVEVGGGHWTHLDHAQETNIAIGRLLDSLEPC